MKTFKYLLITLLSVGLFNSCLIEDETEYDNNDTGYNLATFQDARTTLAAIADGMEYDFDIKVKILGPTKDNVKNNVTLKVEVDNQAPIDETKFTRAVEGVHYKIKNPNITLSPSNNLLGLFNFTMLTEGIETPLAKSPVLVLKISEAIGDDIVTNSGKTITVTLNYACPSFLEGTYDVTTIYTATTGAVSTLNWTETISKTGIGKYRTGRVGHWTAETLGGTPGFTFTDVCGQLSVPSQNLVDLYSNIVEGTDFGTANPETGELYIEYSVCTATGCRYYKSTYVRVKD
jgi:hypothetical protein